MADLLEEPAALTYDENRFEQIEDTLVLMDDDHSGRQRGIAKRKGNLDTWTKQSLAELQKSWVYIQLPNGQQGVMPREALLGTWRKRRYSSRRFPLTRKIGPIRSSSYTRNVKFLESELDKHAKERTDLAEGKRGTESRQLGREAAHQGRRSQDEPDVRRISICSSCRGSHFTICRASRSFPTAFTSSTRRNCVPFALTLRKASRSCFLLGPRNEERETPPGLGRRQRGRPGTDAGRVGRSICPIKRCSITPKSRNSPSIASAPI